MHIQSEMHLIALYSIICLSKRERAPNNVGQNVHSDNEVEEAVLRGRMYREASEKGGCT